MAAVTSTQPSIGNPNLPPRAPTALPLGAQNLWPRSESHGVSISLPTWTCVPAILSKDPEVLKHVTFSYPRFILCPPVRALLDMVLARLKASKDTTSGIICPSPKSAIRCLKWLRSLHPHISSAIEIVNFAMPSQSNPNKDDAQWEQFSVVVVPLDIWKDAMAFWRDTGAGVTTRHADHCISKFGYLESDSSNDAYRTQATRVGAANDVGSQEHFRNAITNLDGVKNKISELLISDHPEQTKRVEPSDIFIYKCGMSAIYALSESIAELDPDSEVCAFGWLYPETVNILRFSPYKSCVSLKWGSEEELDQLENILISGRRISLLVCELPSNIKLICPNLERIKALSKKYGFITACDDTVGNFVNIDVLPWVDVVITSLTKIFSGASNVTAGSIAVNPVSPHYERIKTILSKNYENAMFPIDLAILRQNCQDIEWRVHKSNENAIAVADLLKSHPLIKQFNFATLVPTAHHYRRHMRAPDRQGNVMSMVFHRPETAAVFYDHINACKGSSFGTNFTLLIPFVQLAGYFMMDQMAKYGVPSDIVRINVGLEDKDELIRTFKEALDVAEKFQNGAASNGVVNGNHTATKGKSDKQVGKDEMAIADHEEVYDRAQKTNGHA